jgi:hypothetical protein
MKKKTKTKTTNKWLKVKKEKEKKKKHRLEECNQRKDDIRKSNKTRRRRRLFAKFVKDK